LNLLSHHASLKDGWVLGSPQCIQPRLAGPWFAALLEGHDEGPCHRKQAVTVIYTKNGSLFIDNIAKTAENVRYR
jgi:hypothetical protein